MFSYACGAWDRTIDFIWVAVRVLAPGANRAASRGQLTADLYLSMNCGGRKGASQDRITDDVGAPSGSTGEVPHL